uniref:UMOD/GP2/OIT3-like D8C domain-containing protein n=1 Tax=Haplochromis burtoni TaxID=8153 RepID=A0A3Q2V154_HAPBU
MDKIDLFPFYKSACFFPFFVSVTCGGGGVQFSVIFTFGSSVLLMIEHLVFLSLCWYRLFLGESGAHIPERCLDPNRCGTHAPLWITQPHPTQSGEILTRTVCSSWEGNCCKFESHIIHVKHCYGNYYVYKLVKPVTCQLAYCAGIMARSPVT